jgi:hypothetical protein
MSNPSIPQTQTQSSSSWTEIPLNQCQTPWTSMGIPCSGNGICVMDNATISVPIPKPRCLCNSGWNGMADFKVTTSITDCQMSDIGIPILWGLLLFSTITAWIISLPKSKWLYSRHLEKAKKFRSQGKSYHVYDNRALLSCLISQSVLFPVVWIMCFIKLTTNQLVGVDWAPTVMWWWVRTVLYACTFMLQYSLVKTLLRSHQDLDHLIQIYKFWSVATFIGAVSGQFVSIWPLTTDVDPLNPTAGIVAVSFYGIMFAISMMGGAVQAKMIERRVVETLNKSLQMQQDDKISRIRDKLGSMQTAFARTMIVQATMFLIVGCIPIMWQYHGWFLPISWQAIGPLLNKSLNSITDEEKKKKGSESKDNTADKTPMVTSANRKIVQLQQSKSDGNIHQNNNNNSSDNNEVLSREQSNSIMSGRDLALSLDNNSSSTSMIHQNSASELKMYNKTTSFNVNTSNNNNNNNKKSASITTTTTTSNNNTLVAPPPAKSPARNPNHTNYNNTTNNSIQVEDSDDIHRGVEQRVSPAMKVLAMMTPKKGSRASSGASSTTPSSKLAKNKQQYFFGEDGEETRELKSDSVVGGGGSSGSNDQQQSSQHQVDPELGKEIQKQ